MQSQLPKSGGKATVIDMQRAQMQLIQQRNREPSSSGTLSTLSIPQLPTSIGNIAQQLPMNTNNRNSFTHVPPVNMANSSFPIQTAQQQLPAQQPPQTSLAMANATQQNAQAVLYWNARNAQLQAQNKVSANGTTGSADAATTQQQQQQQQLNGLGAAASVGQANLNPAQLQQMQQMQQMQQLQQMQRLNAQMVQQGIGTIQNQAGGIPNVLAAASNNLNGNNSNGIGKIGQNNAAALSLLRQTQQQQQQQQQQKTQPQSKPTEQQGNQLLQQQFAEQENKATKNNSEREKQMVLQHELQIKQLEQQLQKEKQKQFISANGQLARNDNNKAIPAAMVQNFAFGHMMGAGLSQTPQLKPDLDLQPQQQNRQQQLFPAANLQVNATIQAKMNESRRNSTSSQLSVESIINTTTSNSIQQQQQQQTNVANKDVTKQSVHLQKIMKLSHSEKKALHEQLVLNHKRLSEEIRQQGQRKNRAQNDPSRISRIKAELLKNKINLQTLEHALTKSVNESSKSSGVETTSSTFGGRNRSSGAASSSLMHRLAMKNIGHSSKSGSSSSNNAWQSSADNEERNRIIQSIIKVIQAAQQPNGRFSKKVPTMAKHLEERLYRNAKSKEEYADTTTLKKRLQMIAERVKVSSKIDKETNGTIGQAQSSSTVSRKISSDVNGGKKKDFKEAFDVTPSIQPERSKSKKYLSKSDIDRQEGKAKESCSKRDSISSQSSKPSDFDDMWAADLDNIDNKGQPQLENARMKQVQKLMSQVPHSQLQMINDNNKKIQDQKKKVLRQQQQRLLLLRHASKCTRGPSCPTRFCSQMVQLWNHMKKCRDKDCKTAHCLSSRCVLNHYRICKTANRTSKCEVCAPVIRLIRQQEEQLERLQSSGSEKNPTLDYYLRMSPPTICAPIGETPSAMPLFNEPNQLSELKTKNEISRKSPSPLNPENMSFHTLQQGENQNQATYNQQQERNQDGSQITNSYSSRHKQLQFQQQLALKLRKEEQHMQQKLQQQQQQQQQQQCNKAEGSSNLLDENLISPSPLPVDNTQNLETGTFQNFPVEEPEMNFEPMPGVGTEEKVEDDLLNFLHVLADEDIDDIETFPPPEPEINRKRSASLVENNVAALKKPTKLARLDPPQSVDNGLTPVDVAASLTRNTIATEDNSQQTTGTNNLTVEQDITKKCLPLVRNLLAHPDGWVFKDPVDPEELGLPDYFDVIKNPMDLSLVEKRLETFFYTNVQQFKFELNLVFGNAILYNGENSDVGKMALKLQRIFEEQFAATFT